MVVYITPGKVPQQIHSAEKTAKASKQDDTEHRFAIPASVSEQTAVPMASWQRKEDPSHHRSLSHCHEASGACLPYKEEPSQKRKRIYKICCSCCLNRSTIKSVIFDVDSSRNMSICSWIHHHPQSHERICCLPAFPTTPSAAACDKKLCLLQGYAALSSAIGMVLPSKRSPRPTDITEPKHCAL